MIDNDGLRNFILLNNMHYNVCYIHLWTGHYLHNFKNRGRCCITNYNVGKIRL